MSPAESSKRARWAVVFGPGAIIASLTIGAGELIFSTRAGSLFGYRLLWVFFLILLVKWGLVVLAGRQMVLTGAHPFERWMSLPGPRGWLPAAFFILALVAFPIWVGFHAGTLGTFLLAQAPIPWSPERGHLVWGMLLVAAVLSLSFSGGYARLERLQLAIVIVMLVSVLASLFALHPDGMAFVKGLFLPSAVHYPEWAATTSEFQHRPVWIEVSTYVGVLGGSGYDYLAYVSYLRSKQWGRAGGAVAGAEELEHLGRDRASEWKSWIRLVVVDATISFLAVLVFTAVFVICGAELLGPRQLVPEGNNLLNLQAMFVSRVYPWLAPLYFIGAFFTIFGTLYGTLEVAPVIFHEFCRAARIGLDPARSRKMALWWAGGGGAVVLAIERLWPGGNGNLVYLLTPANLFTGVLACGMICALSLWVDRKFIPGPLRAGLPLLVINGVGAVMFGILGVKSYFDSRPALAVSTLAVTLGLACLLARRLREHRRTP